MRYSILQVAIQSSTSIVVYPQKLVPSSVHAIKVMKSEGYTALSTVDGMIHMQRKVGISTQKIVAIPETHPLFNSFILYEEDFTALQVHKALDIIRDECRRVILER